MVAVFIGDIISLAISVAVGDCQRQRLPVFMGVAVGVCDGISDAELEWQRLCLRERVVDGLCNSVSDAEHHRQRVHFAKRVVVGLFGCVVIIVAVAAAERQCQRVHFAKRDGNSDGICVRDDNAISDAELKRHAELDSLAVDHAVNVGHAVVFSFHFAVAVFVRYVIVVCERDAQFIWQ